MQYVISLWWLTTSRWWICFALPRKFRGNCSSLAASCPTAREMGLHFIVSRETLEMLSIKQNFVKTQYQYWSKSSRFGGSCPIDHGIGLLSYFQGRGMGCPIKTCIKSISNTSFEEEKKTKLPKTTSLYNSVWTKPCAYIWSSHCNSMWLCLNTACPQGPSPFPRL